MSIEKIITFGVSVLIVLVKGIWDIIRKNVNESTRVKVEEIAVVVEALYDGATSAEKLTAFKALAKQKGLNVKRAVEYLETKIIPITKSINSYIKKDNTKKDDKERTN